MHSYFSYPIFDEIAASTVENWKILQRFLGNRLEMALSAITRPIGYRPLIAMPISWPAILVTHILMTF